jgi:hypothetical protein
MGYLWQKVLSNLHMTYGLSFKKILQCRRSELRGNSNGSLIAFILLFRILMLDRRALYNLVTV